MRIETVLLVSVVVVAAVLTSATAEYVWNGSEWVWKEKEVSYKRLSQLREPTRALT